MENFLLRNNFFQAYALTSNLNDRENCLALINYIGIDYSQPIPFQSDVFLNHFDRSFHSCSSEEFLSRAHPEVWGDVGPSTSAGDSTLVWPQDFYLYYLEETLRSNYLTPPNLPPKPKVGAAMRGPPPRPPTKQLASLSHLIEAPIMDKFSVSFV